MITLGAFENTRTQLGNRRDVPNPYFERRSLSSNVYDEDDLEKIRERFQLEKYLKDSDIEEEETDADQAMLRYTRVRRMDRTNGMVANAKILTDGKDQRVLNQTGSKNKETDAEWEEKLENADLLAADLTHTHIQGSALTEMQLEKLLEAFQVTDLTGWEAAGLLTELVSMGAITDVEKQAVLGGIDEDAQHLDLTRHIADESARYTARYNEIVEKGNKLTGRDLARLDAIGGHLLTLAKLRQLAA